MHMISIMIIHQRREEEATHSQRMIPPTYGYLRKSASLQALNGMTSQTTLQPTDLGQVTLTNSKAEQGSFYEAATETSPRVTIPLMFAIYGKIVVV